MIDKTTSGIPGSIPLVLCKAKQKMMDIGMGNFKNHKRKTAIFFYILLGLSLLTACNSGDSKTSKGKTEIHIFHAGSLSVPMKLISETYMDQHPEVVILNEAAGSLSCIRKITELGRDADIIASADYRLINKLLMPAYCSWNIRFASNEMVIAFNDKSAKGDDIDSTNFFNILAEDEITYGRSNPDCDPCGYRTVLCLKLAANYFNNNKIPGLLQKDNELIRPKETDLIALLETGNIDYMFIYRSVAQQHGLRYIILPDAINLKNPELSDYYASVSVETAGKAPGETMIQKGEPMVYGISILNNAPCKEQAADFLNFFMDEAKGLKILDSLGQPPFIPAPADSFGNLPPKLKKHCTPVLK